jgi:tetratricopeptide (TPR) repeat protein
LDDDAPVVVTFDRSDQIAHLLAVGQVRRAKELAVEEISQRPDDPASYFGLAQVLLAAGDAKPAAEAARQAVERAPEWSAAWAMLAITSFRLGRFAAAESGMLEAIRLAPDVPHYFNQYARVLSVCGREEEALDLVARSLELDPEDEDAHQLFASLLHEVKPSKWRLSEEAARRAVALNPDDDDGYAILGTILLSQRRWNEAEECFRTALEIAPYNRLAIDGLAHVVMGRNILYRPFLAYALTMRKLGVGAQLLVVGSVWGLASLIRALLGGSPWGEFVTVGYLGICAYTWFAEPAMRAILRRKYSWL